MNDVQDIDYEFINSQSYKRILKYKLFQDTEYIFEKNYNEIFSNLNDKKDIKRLIHNYLAANSTLIDHTRILITYFPEIEKEFADKIKSKYANSLLNNFMKDLRNYNIHFKLPLLMRPVIFVDNDLSVQNFVISKEHLMRSYKWSKLSREYLVSLENDIELNETFNTHFNSMVELYDWLEKLMKKNFQRDFDKFEEFETKL